MKFEKVAKGVAKLMLKAMATGFGGIVIGAIVDKGLGALDAGATIKTAEPKPEDMIETEAKVTEMTAAMEENAPEPEVETTDFTEVEA